MADLNRAFPAHLLDKCFLADVPESVYRDCGNSQKRSHNQGNKFMSLLLKKVQDSVQMLKKKTDETPINVEAKSNILNIRGAGQALKNAKPNANERFVDKNVCSKKSQTLRHAAVEFNAAAWLRFNSVPDKQISLLVVYEDSEGEHAVIADECSASADGQVMLSGKISIESMGKLHQMSVFCGGVDKEADVVVDELHVKKVIQNLSSEKSSVGDSSENKEILGRKSDAQLGRRTTA